MANMIAGKSNNPPNGIIQIIIDTTTIRTKLTIMKRDTGVMTRTRERHVASVRTTETTNQTVSKSMPSLPAPSSVKYSRKFSKPDTIWILNKGIDQFLGKKKEIFSPATPSGPFALFVHTVPPSVFWLCSSREEWCSDTLRTNEVVGIFLFSLLY